MWKKANLLMLKSRFVVAWRRSEFLIIPLITVPFSVIAFAG